ncbi:hypothetical protein [Streptomyces pseudovenezuelae]|uniref:Uncharacterized protein n=1 Tax=Streptomyces pseudovenezuelae TaxID=67350 RepID=A0ABT6M183_9ACTN|nr:hypothetical protein [Streptomyces pseudovenezuelae]MDH6222323.1 hypothetical protein [Streptomyces pseudovenezuelae]
MMTSTTTLAIGTGAGSLALTAVSFLVTGVLATYTLLHHKQVFAWMRTIRSKDEANTELDKPAEWLADLYKAQCRLAQKPCRADDFEDISQINNMIKGIADHVEAVRPELAKVVERVDEYIATALPDPGPAVKVPLLEHRTQLARAMRQEAARNELVRAVIAAQQKIKTQRHS